MLLNNVTTFLFISFCLSCTSVKNDMEMFCVTAETISLNDSISQSDKLTIYLKELNLSQINRKTKKLMFDLAQVSEIKYEYFQEFAEKNGLENWNCEALKELLTN